MCGWRERLGGGERRSVVGPEVGLGDAGERLCRILEKLAQELVRGEVAQAVEELDLGGGVEELGRAEVEVEFGAVEAGAEREQLEELGALILSLARCSNAREQKISCET